MEIQAVGIIGANGVGTGAAELFLRHGFQVRLYDDFKDSLAVALARIAWSLRQDGREDLLAGIEGIQDLGKFKGADIVIETASKSAEERKVLFSRLLKGLDDACLVAARCAVRPLSELLDNSGLPRERTLGLNFSKPVGSSRLAELVRTPQIKDEHVEAVGAMLRRIDRTPVVVKDNPGQIVQRLTRPFILAAMRLLEAGKGCPHEIDAAFREVAKAPAGPFETADAAGLDQDYAAAEFIHEALGRPERLAPSPAELRLVQYGQLGRKSTIGFYIYEEGRIVGENPILKNLVKYLGLRKIGAQEIFGELMRPVVEEAKLLAPEIMASEYDIETCMKLALGWPKGPFAYSRELGSLLAPKKASEFDSLDTF